MKLSSFPRLCWGVGRPGAPGSNEGRGWLRRKPLALALSPVYRGEGTVEGSAKGERGVLAP